MSTLKFDDSYNVSMASDYLGISRTTFYKLMKKHNFKPSGRMGAMSIFSRDDLVRIQQFLN
jgi:predicted DNA-binding transcriptional regulator AlpA